MNEQTKMSTGAVIRANTMLYELVTQSGWNPNKSIKGAGKILAKELGCSEKASRGNRMTPVDYSASDLTRLVARVQAERLDDIEREATRTALTVGLLVLLVTLFL